MKPIHDSNRSELPKKEVQITYITPYDLPYVRLCGHEGCEATLFLRYMVRYLLCRECGHMLPDVEVRDK